MFSMIFFISMARTPPSPIQCYNSNFNYSSVFFNLFSNSCAILSFSISILLEFICNLLSFELPKQFWMIDGQMSDWPFLQSMYSFFFNENTSIRYSRRYRAERIDRRRLLQASIGSIILSVKISISWSEISFRFWNVDWNIDDVSRRLWQPGYFCYSFWFISFTFGYFF